MAAAEHPGAKGKSPIVRDHKVLGGEPAIRGTRISVRSVVLAAREYGGPQGVRTAYPDLEPHVIEQALRFYDDHRNEIDQYIRENLADA